MTAECWGSVALEITSSLRFGKQDVRFHQTPPLIPHAQWCTDSSVITLSFRIRC